MSQTATRGDATEACRLSYPENVGDYTVGAPGLWPRILRNFPDGIPVLESFCPYTQTSVLDGLHTNDSLPRTTINPNAEFSANGDRVLLDADNAGLPVMVVSVSRDPRVELTFDRT